MRVSEKILFAISTFNFFFSQAMWFIIIVPILRRLGQRDYSEFEAILGSIIRPSLKM